MLSLGGGQFHPTLLISLFPRFSIRLSNFLCNHTLMCAIGAEAVLLYCSTSCIRTESRLRRSLYRLKTMMSKVFWFGCFLISVIISCTICAPPDRVQGIHKILKSSIIIIIHYHSKVNWLACCYILTQFKYIWERILSRATSITR